MKAGSALTWLALSTLAHTAIDEQCRLPNSENIDFGEGVVNDVLFSLVQWDTLNLIWNDRGVRSASVGYQWVAGVCRVKVRVLPNNTNAHYNLFGKNWLVPPFEARRTTPAPWQDAVLGGAILGAVADIAFQAGVQYCRLRRA